MTSILETVALGKRYGNRWALRDCTLAIPAGRVVALVGPNGAGKTTLLQIAVGLQPPTTGTVKIAGFDPIQEATAALPRMGFLAQEHPLYRGYTISEIFHLGQRLNARWDMAMAEARMDQLGLSLKHKVGRLSGGQAAQVALVMALAKHPKVLVLDEPFASLDPLARRDFTRILMAEVAAEGMSVILSSHLVADLERVCDYLMILVKGQLRLAGELDDLLATHRRVSGPRTALDALANRHTVIAQDVADRQVNALVRMQGPIFDPSWEVQAVSLETIVLAYLEDNPALTIPALLPSEVTQ